MKKLFIDNKKKIIIGGTVVGILLLAIVVYLIVDHIHDKKILEKSSIDFNSETYKGKKIEVKGNKIIIYEKNGSKTIETIGDNNEKKLNKATKEEAKKFEISKVEVTKKGAQTVITGSIKSKTDDYKNVTISAKFYRNDALASTSSTTIEDMKKNDTKQFSIKFVGDYSDCTYTVDVEYVD